MGKPLTVRAIDAIKKPASRVELSDGGSPGLFLVVQPSGAKSWAVRYRSPLDGRPRKLTIGPYPAFGLADAREEAGAAVRAVKRGIDPSEARKEAKAKASDTSDLVGALLDDFLARHVDAKNRERTAAEVKRQIEATVRPAWGKRKVGTITRRDVVVLLDEVVDRGSPVAANRLLALVRKFFNWCVERSVLGASPAAGVKAPSEETSRDRVLTDDEIRWVWKATAETGPFNAAVRLLLLTGQRRSEVSDMTRAELEGEGSAAVWHIPPARSKNGRGNAVPLSAGATAAITSVPRLAKSQLVFTSSGKLPISGWSRSKEALDARMLAVARQEAIDAGADANEVELPDWRLHDLRRTAASGMARLGQPIHVIEAVLNHRSGTISGVAAVYNRFDYADEKRRALEAWATYVEDLIAPRTDNVVRLVQA